MIAKTRTFEDNEKVRVTEWRFGPGEETGWHKHQLDYVVVPITTGTLTIVDKKGNKSPNSIKVGIPYFRNAGSEHNVMNLSDIEITFMEMEIK